MKFTQQLVVKGGGIFPGSEGFNPTGSLFIEEEMTPETSGGRCWGSRTVMRNLASIDVLERVAHSGFPMLADVTFEEQVGRKGEKLVVTEIKPIRKAEEPKDRKAA